MNAPTDVGLPAPTPRFRRAPGVYWSTGDEIAERIRTG